MSKITEEIVKHIYTAYGIIPSKDFKGVSITNRSFKLNKHLLFEIENSDVSKSVWGCESLIDGKKISVLYSNISLDTHGIEGILYIHLDESPMYCVYYLADHDEILESNIFMSSNGKSWTNCNLQLQASFLSAMECIRTFIPVWNVCEDYNKEFSNLSNFTQTLEGEDEGS